MKLTEPTNYIAYIQHKSNTWNIFWYTMQYQFLLASFILTCRQPSCTFICLKSFQCFCSSALCSPSLLPLLAIFTDCCIGVPSFTLKFITTCGVSFSDVFLFLTPKYLHFAELGTMYISVEKT